MGELSTVASYGRAAGSSRVRVFDWLDHLGVKADSFTYLGQSSNSLGMLLRAPMRIPSVEVELRRIARSVGEQTLLLSRQASPFSNGKIEHELLSRSARGIYDFDDALMHTVPSRREKVWSKRKVWRRSSVSADVVIAGNDFLAAEAALHNQNVVIIPSCVEPDKYLVKKDYRMTSTPLGVWLGSPSTEQYLRRIERPLLELNESRGLRLLVISSGSASLGELDRIIDRKEWSDTTYQQELIQADFGIMPLDDTQWSRGKCAYKLLQYGAAALPMVGSAVGANTSVLQRADGISVSTQTEWRDAMESLIDEPEARRSIRGRSGRAAVEAHYSFSAWADVWREALGLPRA